MKLIRNSIVYEINTALFQSSISYIKDAIKFMKNH